MGAAGIGLGVALLLTLLLTSRITRPLTAMQAATHRVAEGDMRTELGPTGTQELDELASDFNLMVRRLAERDGRDARVPDARHPRPAHAPDGDPRPRGRARRTASCRPRTCRARWRRSRARPPASRALVADLLDLARLDAHRFTLDLGRVEPADVLDRAFDAMEPEAVGARPRLRARASTSCPRCVTDESRVQQIVTNLLDNAHPLDARRRHRAPRGAARCRAAGFVAAVSDTGPGIPDGDRERIFDAFQSLETPDGRRGSGLGLAISRQLARALGGDVRVESRAGAGSRFVLELPAKGAAAPTGAAARV